MKDQRILIIAHGHPDHNKGGAEIAAYNLFKEYRKRDLNTIFLARTNQKLHGGSTFSTRNCNNEILFSTFMSDQFLFQCGFKKHIWQDFRNLLKRYSPTIVHFHHYVNMGLEMICEVKNTVPNAKIVLTLHEYLAICSNHGQMIKTGNRKKLCYESSPADCALCFPKKTPADFFLREKYIKSIFDLVDNFISPSSFLIERYTKWGIPSKKFCKIENGQPLAQNFSSKLLNTTQFKVNFAFLGQLNPFKGVDVMLKAFTLLPEQIKKKVRLDIHGANFYLQDPAFQAEVNFLIQELKDIVTVHGPYESHEMSSILETCDWVIVPSIWWENSPMVIQEAFNHQIPLICSNIGGMAEKVTDGINGIHFRIGNPNSLARTIEVTVNNKELRDQLVKGIPKALSISSCADSHIQTYNS
jgi:glycosyltransferase involved in cell wall biosynthesis